MTTPAWAEISVSTSAALRDAIAAAAPGHVIVIEPGTYAFESGGRALSARAMGMAERPIVVRSRSPLAARLDLATQEGIVVEGAHWHFEGLDVRGTCAKPADCEHAFHVVGQAEGFVLRESRLVDFNAQIKVNATRVDGVMRMPHRGLIERCDIHDTSVRGDTTPVTKINIDTGDGWIVRDNRIADFAKETGVSYGAFMKSGGSGGVFERNLVICSDRVSGGTGVRIGLSFGGGGTGAAYCAPAFDTSVPCEVEHSGGTMRNNIIVGCNDVGVYLNRAKDTKLLHNTLLATSGVDFRFSTSSGDARGNVIEGKLRKRDGANFTDADNLVEPTLPYADWYVDARAGDLSLRGDVSALIGKAPAHADVPDDYCARQRSGSYDLGALQHSLGSCETGRPPGDSSSGDPDGSSGAGGTSNGSGGSSGGVSGGTDGANANDAGNEGCGCRASHSSARTSGFWLVGGIVWLLRRCGEKRCRARDRWLAR